MRDADISQLIAFAKAYSSVGGTVQHQIDDLLSGEYEHIHPNAIKLAHYRLYGMNEELDEALLDYMEHHT